MPRGRVRPPPCAVALFAVHGRMIVVVALAVVLILGLRQPGGSRGPRQRAALAVAAVGLLAVGSLDHFLITTSYGGHPPDEAGNRLSSLEHLSSAASVARNLVGQSVVPARRDARLAAVVLATGSLRETLTRLRRAPLGARVTLLLLLATGAGLLVVSALSFPDPERADMFIYGRYVEIVAPPFLAVAVAWLLRATSRPRMVVVLAGVAVTTAAAVGSVRRSSPARGSNRWDIAGLPSPPFQLGASAFVLAGVAAAFWAVVIAQSSAGARSFSSRWCSSRSS